MESMFTQPLATAGENLVCMITHILLFVFCILATVSTLNGLSKIKFVSIAMTIGVLSELTTLIFQISRWAKGEFRILYMHPYCIIGRYIEPISLILLCLALLLFCIKYRKPTILFVSSEKKRNLQKTSPEKVLKVLNEQLKLGNITEEEYNAQRAEIISKL